MISQKNRVRVWVATICAILLFLLATANIRMHGTINKQEQLLDNQSEVIFDYFDRLSDCE